MSKKKSSDLLLEDDARRQTQRINESVVKVFTQMVKLTDNSTTLWQSKRRTLRIIITAIENLKKALDAIAKQAQLAVEQIELDNEYDEKDYHPRTHPSNPSPKLPETSEEDDTAGPETDGDSRSE